MKKLNGRIPKMYNTKYSKILTKDFLIQQYINMRKTSEEISKISNCSSGTIIYYLKKYNIPRRYGSSPGRIMTSIYDNILTKNYLEREYIIKRKSVCQISSKIKCSVFPIYKRMRRFGIPIRSFSENNEGKNNPMFGNHSQTGENHWNWKGGKSFEPYPLGWNKTYKEQIRYRDGYKCQLCGCPEVECKIKLHVHHIDYDKENINLENLITLCKSCHSKTNYNRERWKNKFEEEMK